MSPQTASDLQGFHKFLGEKLRNGGGHLSPEEALDEWRQVHPDLEFLDEETAAIQEAIDDMENGDQGRDVDEVLAELRKKYGLLDK